MMMYVMKFLGVIWFLMWYVPREGVLLLLGLPLHVAFAGKHMYENRILAYIKGVCSQNILRTLVKDGI